MHRPSLLWNYPSVVYTVCWVLLHRSWTLHSLKLHNHGYWINSLLRSPVTTACTNFWRWHLYSIFSLTVSLFHNSRSFTFLPFSNSNLLYFQVIESKHRLLWCVENMSHAKKLSEHQPVKSNVLLMKPVIFIFLPVLYVRKFIMSI